MSPKQPLAPLRSLTKEAVPLSAALTALGVEPETVLREGRVFVDGRRQSWPSDVTLTPSSLLEVYPSRQLTSAASPYILGRREGLVAVFKPCELPTEPDRQGTASVITLLAEQLGVNVATLHACSRLDVGVSGVVVIAVNREGREYVEQLRESGGYRRKYLGIVQGCPAEPNGVWHSQVLRRRSRSNEAARSQSLAATSRYRLLASLPAASLTPPHAAALLELCPETGRKHQLRQHCAAAGLPLYGDRRFDGPARIVRRDGSVVALQRIALHAADVSLGVGDRAWHVTAAVPQDFIDIWSTLGGTAQELQREA